MNILEAMNEFDLLCLNDVAAFVDSKLDILDQRAKQSADPDTDGIYDRGEYLAGLGFVACQAYLTESISMSGRDRNTALRLGPQHECGHSIAILINAIANYWKHVPEWMPHPSQRARTMQRAQTTIDLICSLGVDIDSSYVVVNALWKISRTREPRIRYVIPFLLQWSTALRNDV